MLSVYPSENRGYANFGWLASHYTFSFGTYYRPQRRNYGALRALNEHHVFPGEEFAAQSHRDMEVLSYVVSGKMGFSDSVGRKGIVRPGELVRLTAGTGVECREFNASPKQPLDVIQLWVIPERNCLKPGYEQKRVEIEETPNSWCLIGSKQGKNGSLVINQDVNLYMAQLLPGNNLEYSARSARRTWIQIISGSITLNNRMLVRSDGVALNSDAKIQVSAIEPAKVLLIDMPACDD
ncbi:MAG: pirin family protein [Marinobacter sp.]